MNRTQAMEDSQDGNSNGTTTTTPTPKSEKKLALYRWQVAGTLPMFYKDGRVYKPSPEREINFYLKIPTMCHQIIPFIPKFYQVHHKLSVNYDFYGNNHSNNNNNTNNIHPTNKTNPINQSSLSRNTNNVRKFFVFLSFSLLFFHFFLFILAFETKQ